MVLCFVLSCLPNALDETGKRCSPLRLCGPGYFCVDSVCQGTPLTNEDPSDIPFDVNLLSNGGFEGNSPDGGLIGWRMTTGFFARVTPGRTGMFAGRMFARPGNNPSLLNEPFEGTPSFPMLFCAEAWMRTDQATDAGGVLQVRLRDDGGLPTVTDSENALPSLWKRLSLSYAVRGAGELELRIAGQNVERDASVYVDDVVLYRSRDAGCL
jgi:hypothetical protein